MGVAPSARRSHQSGNRSRPTAARTLVRLPRAQLRPRRGGECAILNDSSSWRSLLSRHFTAFVVIGREQPRERAYDWAHPGASDRAGGDRFALVSYLASCGELSPGRRSYQVASSCSGAGADRLCAPSSAAPRAARARAAASVPQGLAMPLRRRPSGRACRTVRTGSVDRHLREPRGGVPRPSRRARHGPSGRVSALRRQPAQRLRRARGSPKRGAARRPTQRARVGKRRSSPSKRVDGHRKQYLTPSRGDRAPWVAENAPGHRAAAE